MIQIFQSTSLTQAASVNNVSNRIKDVLRDWLGWDSGRKTVCPFGFRCYVCSDMFPEFDRDEHDCPCVEVGKKAAIARVEAIVDFTPIEIFQCFSYDSRQAILKAAAFITAFDFDPSEWRARKATGQGYRHMPDSDDNSIQEDDIQSHSIDELIEYIKGI